LEQYFDRQVQNAWSLSSAELEQKMSTYPAIPTQWRILTTQYQRIHTWS
jgi:hypothetical protein